MLIIACCFQRHMIGWKSDPERRQLTEKKSKEPPDRLNLYIDIAEAPARRHKRPSKSICAGAPGRRLII
jgi:hypothetical protein